MFDKRLESRYEELETQVQRWTRYRNWSKWLILSAFIVYAVFIPLLFYVSLINLSITASELNIEQQIMLALPPFYITIAFAARILVIRKARKYRPEADDFMFYHTIITLKNLEGCNKTKSDALRKEYRKKATESGKQILSMMTELWKVGDFGLAKKTFGSDISAISDAMCERVVPILETGPADMLEGVERTMYQFAHYLYAPSIEGLKLISKLMVDLPGLGALKRGFLARCSSFFVTHTLSKHAIFAGVIFALSFVPAFLGVQYKLISIDSAFLFFAAIFGPSIAVYLSHVHKKPPD